MTVVSSERKRMIRDCAARGIKRFNEITGMTGRKAVQSDVAHDEFSGAVQAVEKKMTGFCILEGDGKVCLNRESFDFSGFGVQTGGNINGSDERTV